MAEEPPRRLAIVLPWATILKIALALLAGWAFLRLTTTLVTAFIAVLLAMTLDPLVLWLERRRVVRPLGSVIVTLALVALAGAILWAAVPVAAEQSQLVAGRISDFGRQLSDHLPGPLQAAIHRASSGRDGIGPFVARATSLGASLLRGATSAVLGLALTLYLLIDGRRTYAYVLAYVPLRQRRRVGETAEEVQRIVSAFVAGNVLTSVLAAVFVFVLLMVLRVPAALVLALLAGVFDFLPVIGFILSVAPAVLLALTVSTTAALTVAAAYAAYHLVESYYITPKVYGDRLELSDVAVLIAFAIGFELGGVIGALLALPVAAAYPTVERLWLAERLGRHVVEEHEQIADTPSSEFTEAV